jgi:hypothetical protein
MLSAFVPDVPAVAEFLAVAAMSAAPSPSATSNPIPTRLIPFLPWVTVVWNLVRVPNEDSTTESKWSQA